MKSRVFYMFVFGGIFKPFAGMGVSKIRFQCGVGGFLKEQGVF